MTAPIPHTNLASARGTGATVKKAAGQAADTRGGEGAAVARFAGKHCLPVAPAASSTLAPCPWEQPRPKPNPLTQEPEMGWAAARQLQRSRQAATRTAARSRAKHVKDAGIGAFLAARGLSETEAEQRRAACPIEQAARKLRSRNRIVYRMSVVGGAADLFFVSGLGPDIDAATLIVEAGKLEA